MELAWEEEDEEYFDSKEDQVDISEKHMEEIIKEMETESTF